MIFPREELFTDTDGVHMSNIFDPNETTEEILNPTYDESEEEEDDSDEQDYYRDY